MVLMALLPAKKSSKLGLFSASRPNYNDYQGPSDGDYVRYVEGLMAWAEQEQERQRLRALGANSRSASQSVPDSQWGRSASTPSHGSGMSDTYAQPGSVESAMDRVKRKVHMQAEKLQQQAGQTSAKNAASAGKGPKNQPFQFSVLLFIGALIAISIFAPDWLSLAIVAWVAFSVFRTVRTASRSDKS